MPEYWYDKRERVLPDDERKELNRRIAATKKPKFMIYVYPNERKKYNEFITNSNDKCIIQLGKTIQELIDTKNKTEEESTFLYWYNELCPVGMNDCTVNRICNHFESAFSRGAIKEIATDFDYDILKSDVQYTKTTFDKVLSAYNRYIVRVETFFLRLGEEQFSKDEAEIERSQMIDEFKHLCEIACPNEEELCNIVLDICYSTEKSKQFAWVICGEQIIKNLLKQNENRIHFPVMVDAGGDFEFAGVQFKWQEKEIGADDQ